MAVATKEKRRSPRGNWLVISYHEGEIDFCTWVQTWAGAQASRREKEKYIRTRKDGTPSGRVLILDIERMVYFAATEGADEINALYKLWEKS